MMRPILRGSTDQSVVIRIVDSTDGTPETGVVYNTSGIDLWYRRETEAKVSITEATLAALTTAHADGGFLHIGDGYYRLDLPDAAVASSAGINGVMVGGTVTGMVVVGCYVPLYAIDPYDVVRAGMTALPASGIPGASGGLFIAGTNAATTVTTSFTTTFTGNLTGTIGNLATAAKADVNAEVLDVLATDTFAEPAAVPAATASLKDKIGWMAIQARNKITQTATTQLVKADDTTTTVGTSTVSDDGTTFTRGEFA